MGQVDKRMIADLQAKNRELEKRCQDAENLNEQLESKLNVAHLTIAGVATGTGAAAFAGSAAVAEQAEKQRQELLARIKALEHQCHEYGLRVTPFTFRDEDALQNLQRLAALTGGDVEEWRNDGQVCGIEFVIGLRGGDAIRIVRLGRDTEMYPGTVDDAFNELPDMITALAFRAPLPTQIRRYGLHGLDKDNKKLFEVFKVIAPYWHTNHEKLKGMIDQAFEQILPLAKLGDPTKGRDDLKKEFNRTLRQTFDAMSGKHGRGTTKKVRRKPGRTKSKKAVKVRRI